MLRSMRAGAVFAMLASLAIVIRASAEPAETKTTESTTDQKEALSSFNALVGQWRGVGQPRRGSSTGAWKEEAEWIWDFSDDGVAVRYDVEGGKLMTSARITFDEGAKEFVAVLTTPDKVERTYRGKEEEGKLTLLSSPDDSGEVHRLTVTRLNEKRTLVLFEKHGANQKTFNRVAEVGYTREGTKLASNASRGPECIVTGGEGTIEVSYKGKTYYVCCTGCKQAFEDDPEGVLAEAAERRKEEK